MNNTPSRITRDGGDRACACEDGSYSLDCCDGTIRAQGIGNITGVRYMFKDGKIDCSKNINCNAVIGKC